MPVECTTQEVYLTSEFKVTDCSPQFTKYVKAKFSSV
jgi:hypothetical protein